MNDSWPYVRVAVGDVHRKWVEWGWFTVILDNATAHYAQNEANRERKQREALDRQHRERSAQLARRRALGVQSLNLVW